MSTVCWLSCCEIGFVIDALSACNVPGDGDFMFKISFGVISCVKKTVDPGVIICWAVEGTIWTPLEDAALLLTVLRLGMTGLMASGTFCVWGCCWSGQYLRFTRFEFVKRLGLFTLILEKGLGRLPSKCPWILWCCFSAVPWMKRSPQTPQTYGFSPKIRLYWIFRSNRFQFPILSPVWRRMCKVKSLDWVKARSQSKIEIFAIWEFVKNLVHKIYLTCATIWPNSCVYSHVSH